MPEPAGNHDRFDVPGEAVFFARGEHPLPDVGAGDLGAALRVDDAGYEHELHDSVVGLAGGTPGRAPRGAPAPTPAWFARADGQHGLVAAISARTSMSLSAVDRSRSARARQRALRRFEAGTAPRRPCHGGKGAARDVPGASGAARAARLLRPRPVDGAERPRDPRRDRARRARPGHRPAETSRRRTRPPEGHVRESFGSPTPGSCNSCSSGDRRHAMRRQDRTYRDLAAGAPRVRGGRLRLGRRSDRSVGGLGNQRPRQSLVSWRHDPDTKVHVAARRREHARGAAARSPRHVRRRDRNPRRAADQAEISRARTRPSS